MPMEPEPEGEGTRIRVQCVYCGGAGLPDEVPATCPDCGREVRRKLSRQTTLGELAEILEGDATLSVGLVLVRPSETPERPPELGDGPVVGFITQYYADPTSKEPAVTVGGWLR